jgi:hypothetical protein
MKKVTVILIMVTAITLTIKSQYSRDKEYDPHYGVNVSQIHSGSGHGYGISINTNIQKGRKSLEVGAIYQTRENKIAGADLRYKIFLGHFNEFLVGKKLINPYLQYNLIYQKATVDAPTVVSSNKSTIELPDSKPGIVGTMEHYAALGVQLKLYDSFYIDGSMGIGVYIGTIDKERVSDNFGIHKENHGFTASFKLGIGYRFN